jgi:hypothetical protein
MVILFSGRAILKANISRAIIAQHPTIIVTVKHSTFNNLETLALSIFSLVLDVFLATWQIACKR